MYSENMDGRMQPKFIDFLRVGKSEYDRVMGSELANWLTITAENTKLGSGLYACCSSF